MSAPQGAAARRVRRKGDEKLGAVSDNIAGPIGILGVIFPAAREAGFSSLMLLTDPRRHNPFAQSSEDPDAITRDDVVASLIDVRGEETTALLAVFAELAGDNELLVARIRRELANRPPVEPMLSCIQPAVRSRLVEK